MLDLPEQFNLATHFVDRNVSEGRGEKIAIECGDERVTYRHLLEHTNRVGNALRRLSMRPEERVFLLVPDIPEFLYCFFGAIKIGAVAVPINTLLKPHEYEHLLNDTRARIAIVSEILLSQWQQIPREKLRYLETTVLIGEPASGFLNFRELIEAASPDLKAEPTSKDDPAFGSIPPAAPRLQRVACISITIWWCVRSFTQKAFCASASTTVAIAWPNCSLPTGSETPDTALNGVAVTDSFPAGLQVAAVPRRQQHVRRHIRSRGGRHYH